MNKKKICLDIGEKLHDSENNTTEESVQEKIPFDDVTIKTECKEENIDIGKINFLILKSIFIQ